jgi:DNA processing protein
MEEKFLNAFAQISGVGPQKMSLLLNFFQTAESAWKANGEDLEKSGVGSALAEKIITQRNKINPESSWEALQKEGVSVLTLASEQYPQLLREISNPPFILYIKGAPIFNEQPLLAVVGSRKFTAYGRQVAYKLSQDLVRAGFTIVSGMALGIDAIAHQGALDTGGKTIAVLGSSLEDNLIGPRANFQLSRAIISSGSLISELPLGSESTPGMFPARNRLMAGMTLGTLVVEAALDSGSLITAKLALDFNREVLAVPGSIFSPASEGTNQLIKSGAKLVTGIESILEELQIERKNMLSQIQKIIPATPEEERLLKILSHEPLHIDRIIKITKLKTHEVSSLLSIMEMKGLVKNIGGQNYIII